MEKVIKLFKFIINKLWFLFFIVILAFILPRLIPGSPIFISDSDINVLNTLISEENFVIFKEYYPLDKPIWIQFLMYIKQIFSLDFGYSFYYKAPILDVVNSRIVWTVYISMSSLILSTILGVPMALRYAMGKVKSNTIINIILTFQAFPSLLLAIVFQLIFCYRLRVFPSGGAYSIGVDLNGFKYVMDIVSHSMLPIIVLTISSLPSIFIMTYKVCRKIKEEDFVKMACFYNVDKKIIKYKYIFKNALPEILSKLNIQFLYLISGSLFVENVFSYPGMGTLMKIGALNNDYTLIQSMIVIMGAYGLVINIIFDLAILISKPKIGSR